MSSFEHRQDAPSSVVVHVITVSDTRTLETDASGQAIVELLDAAGHVVQGRTILKDEPAHVRAVVERLVANPTWTSSSRPAARASRLETARSKRWTGCCTSASPGSASCFGR